MAEIDYYKILGVHKGANTSEIKKRYILLSKKYHSDHGGEDSIMTLINEAYEVLSDPVARFKYDKKASSNTKGKSSTQEKTRETKSTSKTPEPMDDFSDIDKGRSKNLIVIIVSVVVIICGISIKLYLNNKNKQQLDKVASLNSQLQSDYNQFASLPSSTTNNKSGWDSYYDGIIGDVQNINNSSQGTYSSNSVNTLSSSINLASTDFLSLLNLDKSSSDMTFQIQDDQSNVNSDNSTIEEYQGDDVTDGEPLMQGEITSEQSSLSTDQTTLKNDQQTLASQQAQEKTLDTTVLNDLAAANHDAQHLGLTN